ncbi:MAG: hypothetical protein DMD64_13430, partial [Gemmatimonadetes bacterium]
MTTTLFDRVWDAHVVQELAHGVALLYVDLHLIHEVTSPQAFEGLRRARRTVRRPERTLATVDHNVPTGERSLPIADPIAARQLDALEANAREFGIQLFDLASPEQGIVHVVGPELGATQPGMVIVCGDSHTSTHGAFGAFALGIGTSEVEHVLATQCIVLSKPKNLEARITGRRGPGVTAKDLILALIGRIGTAGASGHVIEYTGDAIRGLSMEERMTVCNMSSSVRVYYEADTDRARLRDRVFAIIGYGSQGHAHAQNLRDSGARVLVGLRPGGASWKQAVVDGLEVRPVADAAQAADVI